MGASADLVLPIIFIIGIYGVTTSDIEVFVNDSIVIRCSPNESTAIQWHFNSVYEIVYAGGELRPPYDKKFRLKKDKTAGFYNLIIPNVMLEDAGWYYCSEEYNGRRINSTQLTVLYIKPVCSSNMPTDGFIGPNTCNIQKDNMIFTCNAVFYGRPPHLSWRSANDSHVFNSSSCDVKSNRIICNLTLRADITYDQSVFICDVGQIKLNDRRYSCNTQKTKVQYFLADYEYKEKYVLETANCMVRSNLNVRYNWTLQKDDKEILLTSNRTVSIKKSGLHQCKVEYSIRNVRCTDLVSVVNATTWIEAEEEKSITTQLVPAITSALFALAVTIALIGLVIYIQKRRRKKQYFPVRTDKPLTQFELSAIESNHETLPDLIDTSQLIDLLEKNGVFDEVQLNTISSKSTQREKNEALLEILRNGNLSSYWLTIRCLHQSNQSHVAELLETGDLVKNKMDEELTEKEISAIENNRETLLNVIDSSHLLGLLKKNGVFEEVQLNSISSKSTSREKNEVLLEILRNSNLSSYWMAIRCLHQSNQSHVAELLETGDCAASDRLNMKDQKDRLIELIESEFGLLDKLLKYGALTRVQMIKVKSGRTVFEKNDYILQFICSGNKHQDLMKALSECGQNHVVNWVRGNGEYKEEYGDDWPLRETELKILDNNQEALVDCLHASELLPILYAMKEITEEQKGSIYSRPTKYQKNEALLETVRRFSLKSYSVFIRCIRNSGPSHVADMLEYDGFIVPVHARLGCEHLDEVETRIISQMERVLTGNASVEQADHLIAALQLMKVIAMRRGKGIVIYIACNKEEEFVHLCKIIDNSEMRNILEQLFNLLIPNMKIKVLLAVILSKDMEKAKKTLTEIKRKNMITKDNKQGFEYEEDKDSEEERWKMTFDRHHDFIIDRMSPDFGLIHKLYSKFAITEDEKCEINAEKDVHKRNRNLIKCMGRKLELGMLIQVLRESDQKHLVNYLESDGNYRDEFDREWPLGEKEISMIKINYESLIDRIKISDLLDPLCSTGVINKRQREFISSKSTSYEKNEALLEIVRRGSLRSYGLTTICLHQLNLEILK